MKVGRVTGKGNNEFVCSEEHLQKHRHEMGVDGVIICTRGV